MGMSINKEKKFSGGSVGSKLGRSVPPDGSESERPISAGFDQPQLVANGPTRRPVLSRYWVRRPKIGVLRSISFRETPLANVL